MLPKAILFDLDDTIISFEGATEPAWEKCCDIFVNNVKTTFDSKTLFENINKVRQWYWSDPERHKIGRMNLTNGTSEKQRGKINRFCLSDYFDFCLIEEEIGCGKPDPHVYEIALDLLKLNANEVWMVGDNLVWDIEASQKVGIFAIWNDYKGKGLSKDSKIIPDRIISSISELLT